MELAIIIWLISGIAAAMVANSRGANGCLWFGLGVLAGPFGLAAAFFSGETRVCRFCTTTIPAKAIRCPKCHADLSENGSVAAHADNPRTSTLVRALQGEREAQSLSGSVNSFCGKCGAQIPSKSNFCNHCGASAVASN